jgi:hypothetical protein
MKRCFAVLALLLSGAAGLAYADYVVIIINVGGRGDIDFNDPNLRTARPIAIGGALLPNPAAANQPQGVVAGDRPGIRALANPAPGPVVPNPLAEDIEEETPLYVATIVEYGSILKHIQMPDPNNQGSQLPLNQIKHRWGTAWLVPDPLIALRPAKYPSVKANYLSRRNKLKSGATAKQYVELAEWALTHGMIKEVPILMGEAAKLDKDKSNPAVQAFQKVQAELDRPITKSDESSAWKDRLQCKVTQSEHYSLVYDAPSVEPRDVIERRNMLENRLRGFYYWFALKGKAMRVPDRRLVAYLVDSRDQFKQRHAAFDSVSLVADGFFLPHDNILVLSTLPTDEAYDALEKTTKSKFQGWKFEELLSGSKKAFKADRPQLEVALYQTLALAIKSLQEDAAVAGVSHEGARQLISAVGLLPRNVVAPEWIQFGMASFFETPHESPWESVGGPSFLYLREYKDLETKKKLDAPETAMVNTVTDRYFRYARLTNQKSALLKARTMAWALTYYLAQNRLERLLQYYQELSALPRDMEIDETALLDCFARAFDLMDPNGKVDQIKLQNLARDWNQVMTYTPLEVQFQVKEEVQKFADELKKLKEAMRAQQGVPPQPGGLGGPGPQPGVRRPPPGRPPAAAKKMEGN